MTTFHEGIFVVPCNHLAKIRNKTGHIRLARVWTRPSAPCVCRGDKGAQWIIHTKLLFITVFFPSQPRPNAAETFGRSMECWLSVAEMLEGISSLLGCLHRSPVKEWGGGGGASHYKKQSQLIGLSAWAKWSVNMMKAASLYIFLQTRDIDGE